MYSSKLFILATIFSIIPSQLLRINISSSSALNLTDILLTTTIIVFGAQTITTKKKIIIPGYIVPAGLVFFLTATASSVLSTHFFSQKEIAVGLLFLVRLILYTVFSVAVASSIKKAEVSGFIKLFSITGVIFALIGFLQLIFFPNLANLVEYGWDPHINRLVSSTLDPNYAGGLLTVFLCIALSQFLYTNRKIYAAASLMFFCAIVLTFSRSSYIAVLLATLTISAIKSPKIILVPLFLFVISFSLIPTVRSRILGAFTLDDTSRSRIESWQNAIIIFKDKPVFGVGFNNYRSAQTKYGFFQSRAQDGGHSGAGSDSSFLLILATTGSVGFLSFIAWQAAIIKVSVVNLKTSYLSLGIFAAYLGLLIHSQFVNSFFFPQILMSLMFLLGLKHVEDS